MYGAPVWDGGHADGHGPENAVDGSWSTYWESTNAALPQDLTLDMGAAYEVSSVVLSLPSGEGWTARTQQLEIQGRGDDGTWTTLLEAQDVAFDPASGNYRVLALDPATVRYLRVRVLSNSGWPAAQVSELQVYGS